MTPQSGVRFVKPLCGLSRKELSTRADRDWRTSGTNYTKYDQPLIKPARVAELIELVRSVTHKGWRYPVSVSFNGGTIPSPAVVVKADFLLIHGNGVGEPDRSPKWSSSRGRYPATGRCRSCSTKTITSTSASRQQLRGGGRRRERPGATSTSHEGGRLRRGLSECPGELGHQLAKEAWLFLPRARDDRSLRTDAADQGTLQPKRGRMRAAILLLSLLVPAAASARELKAGIARVEITPSSFMPMYGYANRKCGPANGTHDPLFAKVLVLEAGDSRMALVTADLGSLVSDNLRRDVASKLGIPCCCSRPRTRTRRRRSCRSAAHRPPATRRVRTSPISNARFSARSKRRPVRCFRRGSAWGRDPCSWATTGSCSVRTAGRARCSTISIAFPMARSIRRSCCSASRMQRGARRRSSSTMPCTPSSSVPRAVSTSADYPGVVQSAVERELEGTQVMFVQGGAGDINPLFQGRSGREADDFAVMEKMGQLLAAEVLRANTGVKPLAPWSMPSRPAARSSPSPIGGRRSRRWTLASPRS